jgi:hypothetical protein
VGSCGAGESEEREHARAAITIMPGLWGAAPVLDIGDHDPEQVYVFGSLDEDVGALVGEVTRKVVCIAVIQERCERKDLVAWLGELGRRNQE